jgi:hypothetical protein
MVHYAYHREILGFRLGAAEVVLLEMMRGFGNTLQNNANQHSGTANTSELSSLTAAK